MHVEVAQVALGIVAKVGRRRKPNVLAAPSSNVVEYNAGELPPLANTSAIAQEKATPGRRCAGAGRYDGLMSIACESDRLELQIESLPSRSALQTSYLTLGAEVAARDAASATSPG